MTTTPIDQLTELSADEVVTHSYVKHVPLPSGGTLALITLDNGKDYKRPRRSAPHMRELSDVLDTLRAAATAGSIQAVAITGKEYCFAAGADLSQAAALPSREVGHELGALGHATLRKLSDLGVPSSFAFVNGIALGGGLEIALHCTYRVFSSAAQGIGLPEVFLGIIPGWGGATLLPRLIGPEKALRVIVENPLKNNRLMDGTAAVELGIGDALIPSVTFLPSAVAWADGVVSGRTKVVRKNEPGMLEKAAWGTVVKVARQQVASKIGTVPKSPFRALDLVAAAKSGSLDERFADEDDAWPTCSPVTSSPRRCTRSTSCRSVRRRSPSAPPRASRRRRSRRSVSSAPGSWRRSSRCCSPAGSGSPSSSPTSTSRGSTPASTASGPRSTSCSRRSGSPRTRPTASRPSSRARCRTRPSPTPTG